jgi:hypothetical protein
MSFADREYSSGLICRLMRAAALAFLVGTAAAAHAASAANLDIKVSINTSKSVSVDTGTYDFGALPVSVSSVSAAGITVTNDSTGLLETYTIQGANALATGGTPWTLASSTGTDQFSLAAQFSNARPSNVDTSWSSDNLDSTAITATSAVLGNGAPGESGAGVSPSQTRTLWIRIKTPSAVSDTLQHKATLTIAVQ